jgi:hypothetical protein
MLDPSHGPMIARWALGVTAAVVGLQVALAAPPDAAARSGLERTSAASDRDPLPWKVAHASCPLGKQVVGGGAWIDDGGRKRAKLVGMQPVNYSNNESSRDGYRVTAEAPFSPRFFWSVTAYAMCVDDRPGDTWWIAASEVGDPSSATFQSTAAECPFDLIAYGSGGFINRAGSGTVGVGGGRVGLQLMRTSGPLDITRATARETAAGYDPDWRVTAWAVCGERTGDVRAEGQVAPGDTATAFCPDVSKVHGPGGGGGLTDGGPVWLHSISPSPNLREVRVQMTGPLYPHIGGMVAHMTCAR